MRVNYFSTLMTSFCISQSPLEMITNSCKETLAPLVPGAIQTNEWKCNSMVVSRKTKRYVLPTLLLNDHHIEECNTIKYLGINLTSDLMWSRHVQLVSQRARGRFGLLYRQFYQYADTNTMKHLYLLLIRPHLEYVCTV